MRVFLLIINESKVVLHIIHFVWEQGSTNAEYSSTHKFVRNVRCAYLTWIWPVFNS